MSSLAAPIRAALSGRARLISWCVLAGLAFGAIAFGSRHLGASLSEQALVSGYSMLGLVVLLGMFNVRKRFSVLPGAGVRAWTTAHAAGGFLALAVFWLHSGGIWPVGGFERVLATLFYVVALSGVVGVLLQHFYPARLTQSGVEIIFERIPDQIADYRDQAESLVMQCMRNEKSDTLPRFYVETFHWYFHRPRFLLSHLWGGQRASFWVTEQLNTAQRYLNESEQAYLEQLREIAQAKARVDLHFAVQGLMKIWLLVHVPAAVGMLTVALWHLLLVNIYSL